MRIRKYEYSVNHSWMLLVPAESDAAVPEQRKGKLVGEGELDASRVVGDLGEIERRLTVHGHCLMHPANGLLRQGVW